jgi:hypothetical protein
MSAQPPQGRPPRPGDPAFAANDPTWSYGQPEQPGQPGDDGGDGGSTPPWYWALVVVAAVLGALIAWAITSSNSSSSHTVTQVNTIVQPATTQTVTTPGKTVTAPTQTQTVTHTVTSTTTNTVTVTVPTTTGAT